jgi:hypothetical protein
LRPPDQAPRPPERMRGERQRYHERR